jgi:heme exporter protein B
MLTKELKALLGKEIKLEFRHKYALNGILLYVISTVFVSYLSFKQIVDPPTWNALFWIIMLFASINAVSKSFMQDGHGIQLYYYTLASPQAIILSKIIYNSLLMLCISFLCYTAYSLFIGNIVQNQVLFISCLSLGSVGISSILTLVSAIAAKTNNNFSLMAVLSFPIMVPLLLTLMKVSKDAVDGLDFSVTYKYLLVLGLLDVIVLALSYMLFPYLWKD